MTPIAPSEKGSGAASDTFGSRLAPLKRKTAENKQNIDFSPKDWHIFKGCS
jgi:hypothetical protein